LFHPVDAIVLSKSTSRAQPARRASVKPAENVYIDWGPELAEQHALAFLDLSVGGMSANLGPLARDYLLAAGGAGYFRQKVLGTHLTSGRLFRIPDAPEFPYPAYAVYAQHADMEILAPAIFGLKHAAGANRKQKVASNKRIRQ
jgi:hypothetical protein